MESIPVTELVNQLPTIQINPAAALRNGGWMSEHPLVVRIGSRYFDGDCDAWQSSQGMTFIIRRYTVDSGGINFTARDDILSEKITLAAV